MNTDAMDRIRAIYGLSRQIADALGLSPSTVSEWRRVPAHHVQRVAEITGLAPEVLRPDVFVTERRYDRRRE